MMPLLDGYNLITYYCSEKDEAYANENEAYTNKITPSEY